MAALRGLVLAGVSTVLMEVFTRLISQETLTSVPAGPSPILLLVAAIVLMAALRGLVLAGVSTALMEVFKRVALHRAKRQ